MREILRLLRKLNTQRNFIKQNHNENLRQIGIF